MNAAAAHALAFAWGGSVAGAWLLLLWLTVRRLAARPTWVAMSGALRAAAAAAALLAPLALGTWTHAVAALAGFALVRSLGTLAALPPGPLRRSGEGTGP
jgi:hypothetical protein